MKIKISSLLCLQSNSEKSLANSINRRMRRKKIGLHCKYDEDKNSYEILEPDTGIKIHCHNFERIKKLYKKGVADRCNTLWTEYLFDKVPLVDGDSIIDCGANIGEIFICLTRKNIKIKYTGFEPSPIDFKCLSNNAKGQTLYNSGLWNKEETIPFYLVPASADSSFIEPSQNKDNDIINVKTSLLSNHIDGDIKLLKLEAEGAELEVLQGAGDKLKQIQYITADLGPERGLKQESTFAPVTNFLLSRGYELIDIYPKRVTALFKRR